MMRHLQQIVAADVLRRGGRQFFQPLTRDHCRRHRSNLGGRIRRRRRRCRRLVLRPADDRVLLLMTDDVAALARARVMRVV